MLGERGKSKAAVVNAAWICHSVSPVWLPSYVATVRVYRTRWLSSKSRQFAQAKGCAKRQKLPAISTKRLVQQSCSQSELAGRDREITRSCSGGWARF